MASVGAMKPGHLHALGHTRAGSFTQTRSSTGTLTAEPQWRPQAAPCHRPPSSAQSAPTLSDPGAGPPPATTPAAHTHTALMLSLPLPSPVGLLEPALRGKPALQHKRAPFFSMIEGSGCMFPEALCLTPEDQFFEVGGPPATLSLKAGPPLSPVCPHCLSHAACTP